MRGLMLALLAWGCLSPALAQKDFLTADEAEQLRLVQDPEARLKVYLKYADQRMDLLEQLFAKAQTGRSGVIHDKLEELTKIVEAIDTVIDDTLRKRRELPTIEFVAAREREILKKLEGWAGLEPEDANRYAFALDTAIDTVKDSVEMAEEDLKDRARSVDEQEEQLKKQRESMMTPQQIEAQKKAAAKKEEEAAKAKKKPTLLRKGETAPGKQ
jgi:hypothetical protein